MSTSLRPLTPNTEGRWSNETIAAIMMLYKNTKVKVRSPDGDTNYFDIVAGVCWSTYIHKRPNIGNALRGLFTGTQSEKDGSNKARVLSHMSLGVISTKHGVRRMKTII